MNFDPIHEALAEFGHKATMTGGVTTVYAWLVSSEGLGVIGAIVTVSGFAMNFYFKRKEDARRQALFEAEMAALKARGHE